MFSTRYLIYKISFNHKTNTMYLVYFYLRHNVENETLTAVSDRICK